MGAGLIYSLTIHGLVIAFLLLLPSSAHDPAPVADALVVDLVPGAPGGAAASDADTPTVTPAIRETATRPPEKITDTVTALLRLAQAAHGATGGGSGQSGVGQSLRGNGSSTLKDFIRAQIERRWQIDAGAPNMTVTLRLMIAADGSVLSAAVLEDPGRDRAKQSVTLAARNAALLSSPLQFPPDLGGAGELTLELNTRDTRR